MPNKIRFCIVCKRYDRKTRLNYTRIYTPEREEKLLEGYRRRYKGQELSRPILNELVHQKCYNKIVQGVSSNDSNEILPSIEQNKDDTDEEQEKDQTSLIQFRSRMPFPSKSKKHLFERRQRVCAICNRYGYRSHNKMKQIVSNFMANKLAEGYSYIHKKPYGQSLLDAYIHETCFRKLYSSYRYHTSKKFMNQSPLRRHQPFARQLLISPHETRSRSNLDKSSMESESRSKPSADEPANLSIERLFSTPLYTSITTTNTSAELSARSCLFRPCIQRLTSEEIEFYTKRKLISNRINDENPPIDQLPTIRSSVTQTLTTDASVVYSNQDIDDNDIHINEQDRSPDWTPTHLSSSPSVFNKTENICTSAAKIRRRYLKPPPLAKPTNPLIPDHTYINNITVKKPPVNLEKLVDWLMEELKSSPNPMSMGEVLQKYKELIEEGTSTTTRENVHRERLRHQLEKYYSSKFIFVTPNKREGTFVALHDIDHYVRYAIKNAKQEKEKATEASILSSIVLPPTPIDHSRQTCEVVMNGIRKIRLYIRDAKQLDSSPSLFMRNVVGLISTSEKQFHKISQQYDFYRMIDEDLFDNGNDKISNKVDKSVRNMSLASDLISARHDNRISKKHFQLADEFTKKNFNSTPKQIITLLNRYGHTCSYKSYTKMKASKERTTNELEPELIDEIETIIRNDDKSSDSEMDLMEF
ncbi:unnamed protein product [Rotaria magnacalcarata]|uniref:Uncharacterized protein n=1 Tax=Rotaria magnacalcarata TaxID=392030 RepID=A0A817AAH5_9BILA|nr:unnamed protein product [Rotaria magnacalcarata]CAF3774927.1 unnamed protein product [Rotaria magnacalcarata]